MAKALKLWHNFKKVAQQQVCIVNSYIKEINFKKYIFQKDILEYNISYNHFVWAQVCYNNYILQNS